MNDLIINKEKLATRCEVCHQSDMFLPEPNICFRCVQVDFDDEPKKKTRKQENRLHIVDTNCHYKQ